MMKFVFDVDCNEKDFFFVEMALLKMLTGKDTSCVELSHPFDKDKSLGLLTIERADDPTD